MRRPVYAFLACAFVSMPQFCLAASVGGSRLGSPPAANRTPAYAPRPKAPASSGRPTSNSATATSSKSKLDSVGDMSQLEQMRMQSMMDRRSKALETLSNIQKKQSDTSKSIINNIR